MIVRHCASKLMVFLPSVFAIRPTCCPLAVGITASRRISRTSDFILRLVREIRTPVVSPRGSSELFRGLVVSEERHFIAMLTRPERLEKKGRGNRYGLELTTKGSQKSSLRPN